MNNNIKYIYINLDNRPERNKHIKNLLSKLNVKFQRYNAIKITSDNVPKTDDLSEYIISYLKHYYLNPRGFGTIGCYLSHKNCIILSKSFETPYTAICEDDIVINENTLNKLNSVLNYFNNNNIDWDMFRVLWDCIEPNNSFCHFVENIENIKMYKFNTLHWRSKFNINKEPTNSVCGGAHFYIINNKKIDKILEYLDSDFIFDLDAVISTSKLNIYFCLNNDMDVNLVYSTINPDGSEMIWETDIPKLEPEPEDWC